MPIKSYIKSHWSLAVGVLTTSSTTVPADTGRTEVTNYWDGCYLLPLSGVAAYQPRLITTFTATTGVFTLAVALTTLPGLVEYIILPP